MLEYLTFDNCFTYAMYLFYAFLAYFAYYIFVFFTTPCEGCMSGIHERESTVMREPIEYPDDFNSYTPEQKIMYLLEQNKKNKNDKDNKNAEKDTITNKE